MALLLTLFLFSATTLIWLRLHRAPPQWDDAWYLTNSLAMYDALADQGLLGFAKKFFTILGFKAPLITVLPTPFYLIFGRRWHAAFAVNLVAMAVLFAALFWIAKKLGNSRAGLIAIYITGTMPLLYGLSRWFLVEYTLTACVAVAIALLIASEGLERTPAVLACGVVFGLGLLLKVSFPLFVAAPLGYAFFAGRRRWKPIFILTLPCIIVALPWYALNYRRTIDTALGAWRGDTTSPGRGVGLLLSELTSYLLSFIKEGVSVYYVALGLLMLTLLVVRRRDGVFLPRASLLISALWMAPTALLLFGGYQDVRYFAPLLPGFALMIALAMESSLGSLKHGGALTCLALAFPLLSMTSISFGFPIHEPALGYAHTYSRRSWPQQEILAVIARDAEVRPGEKRSLLLGSDRGSFNANNFELAVFEARLPFNVSSTAYEGDLEAVLRAVDGASFVVYKEGGEPESASFGRFYKEMVEHIRHEARFVELPYGRRLPDGGLARIFKNTGESVSRTRGNFVQGGHARASEWEVVFNKTMALDDFSARRDGQTLRVLYRWHCIRPPDREYWCFTHILDGDGKIVGYLDHKILDGHPPLTAWQSGDAASEELRFPIPPELANQSLRLRLGLYHVASGDRLSLGPLSGGAALTFSSTDQGTALLTAVIQ